MVSNGMKCYIAKRGEGHIKRMCTSALLLLT